MLVAPAPGGASAVAALTPPLAAAPGLAGDAPTLAAPGRSSTTGAPNAPLIPAQPTGPLAAGQAFGRRYQIIRLLGAGGMGAVYQAWDDELNVAVALKVIRPEALVDASAAQDLERRFKRELVLARQVTHRNVVRIHDLGEIDGVKYLTMPYVQGADLHTVLQREGRLPGARALRMARQVAAGLAAAHEVGVVHRDLKPANILIDSDDTAIITDFGIARSTASAAATMATAPGAVVGTLEYMAPEQARAEPADQRADIYAFGLIVYDMLLGLRRGGTSESALAELMSRMQQQPPPPRAVDPGIPEALDRIVMHCLAPDPAARYQTTAELAADLDRLTATGHEAVAAPARRGLHVPLWAAAAGAALVLTGGAGVWWVADRITGGAEVAVARAPLLVLIADFENRTGDPVFEGALEQALGVGIESASFITSFPRRDARRAAEQIQPGVPLDESVARLVSVREGLDVVLAGTVAPSGSGYALSLRAVTADDGRVLDTVTATAADKAGVLAAIGDLASKIRRRLGDTTGVGADLIETFTAASLEAADAYAEAQDLAAAGRHEEALAQYQKAVALDPNFGRAYSGWATSAFRLGRREEAERLYEKAFGLLDRMTEREKFRTLGVYYGAIARNYEKAIENYQALVEKYPSDGAGHNNLAVAYFNTLDFQKASEAGRRVLDIYPKRLLYRSNYALYAMYAGDFDTAVAEARNVLDEDPAYAVAYLPLAVAAASQGRVDEAQAAYEAMARGGAQGASRAAMGLADLMMLRGRFGEAVRILDAAIAADEQSGNRAGMAAKLVALAEARQALGQTQASLEAVRQALEIGRQENVAFPAGRVLLRAGRAGEARSLAASLSNELSPRSRAYGRLLDGEIALARGRLVDAVEGFGAARDLANVWLARFDLGRAYIEAGRHAEALSELELCQRRRGEATAVFLDDAPTLRYLGPLHYWLARAQEGLGLAAPARENYRAFLALAPEGSGDPLVADARRRLTTLGSP